jgi:phospholipase/carboxylesterase
VQGKNESETIEVGDWTLRVQKPESDRDSKVFFLNHGWTGDETSMWIFASQVNKNNWLIAPRAPFPASLGGFSWVDHALHDWPGMKDFSSGVTLMLDLLDELPGIIKADFSRVHMMGFSQGGAFSTAFALLHPKMVNSLAGLSSFFPNQGEELVPSQPLLDMPVFVAHGKRDDVVPVEFARYAVDQLEQAGAEVTYCESNARHKLDIDCYAALKEFYKEHI